MLCRTLVLLHVYLSFPQDLSQLELAERFRKTLYYGKTPTTDRPSLPMTGSFLALFLRIHLSVLGKPAKKLVTVQGNNFKNLGGSRDDLHSILY